MGLNPSVHHADLQNWEYSLSPVKTSEEDEIVMEQFRIQVIDLGSEVFRQVANSTERDNALFHLQSALFWINAGVAHQNPGD